MSSTSFLSRRLDRSAAPLAVGDLVVLIGLLTIGALQHNTVAYLQANPVYLLGVLAPFLIGWAIAAPVVGAYSPGAVESAKSSLPLTIRSWVPAAAIAFVLRASPLFHGGVQLSFVAVVFLLGLVSLTGWRYVYFLLRG